MRSRHALAILTRMNVHETIASSKEDYIRIAVRLGQDSEYRQAIANKIAEQKHKLYGDREPIEALQQFLIQTVKGNQWITSGPIYESQDSAWNARFG